MSEGSVTRREVFKAGAGAAIALSMPALVRAESLKQLRPITFQSDWIWGGPNAGFIVPAVDATDPLFHLMNGDLCYANLSDDPVATWSSFFNTNMPSAAVRPWMPAAGNHENEVGNGPDGYKSYQTRFTLPDNGERHFG